MVRAASLALALGLSVVSVQVQDRQSVALSTHLNGICVVRRAGVVVSEQRGRDFVFPCPSQGEDLSCDFEGAEPIDTPLTEVCRTKALPLQMAKPITVEAREAVSLTVEWLVFTPEARGVPILATRRTGPDRRQTLLVAERDERFVRFTRLGVSPVTVRATELLAHETWALPESGPGGELIARIEPAAVLPESFSLSGPWTTDVRAGGDLLVLRGLKPGRYQLVPVYAGAVRGRERYVPIRDGQSSPMYIRRENVGAVHVSAVPGLCEKAAALRITRTTSKPSSGGLSFSRDVVTSIVLDGTCSKTVSGLAAGDYEVSYLGPGGPLAAQQFTVVAGNISSVTVTAPTARVFGRILVNGKAASDVEIRFRPDDSAPGVSEIAALTDPGGFYEIWLQEPGVFRVEFKKEDSYFLTGDRRVKVTEGDNPVDWPIESQLVRVDVTGWNRAAPLVITVNRVSMSEPGRLGAGRRLSPADALPVVIEGLASGDYRIEVRQQEPDSPTPGPMGNALVTLSKEHPETNVSIDLKAGDRSLLVVDRAGAPVDDATVVVNDGAALPAMSPGMFSLASVAPGAALTVLAPGFVRVCRIASADPRQRVVVDPGVPVRLVFSGRSDVTRPPGRLLWSGSDCPVPLDRLEFVGAPTETVGVTAFLVEAFPRDGSLVFIATPFDRRDEWQPIRIEPDGTVHIRLPKDK